MMSETRRAKFGRGSVYPAKDKNGKPIKGVWRIQYAWTDKAGERHRECETWHGKKSGAYRRLEEIKLSHDQGVNLDGSKVTFAEFAADWQQAREESGELAEHTLTDSARYVRTLSEYIGGLALADIDAEKVARLMRSIRRDRRGRHGGAISNRTLLAYYQCLNQILKQACNWDYILRNPCDKVKPPKPADVERRSLSTKDARRLLATLEREERKERAAFETKEQRQIGWNADQGRGAIRGLHKLANIVGVRIGLATGMRLGEVAGLTWADVDLTGQCLHVSQSLTQKGNLKKPKTIAGKRTIWLDVATAAHLAEWKRFQTKQLRKIGKIQEGQKAPESIPVVCSDIGGFTNVNNFGAWWRSWRERNGFTGLKFHELRHTQATQLLANGVDVKTVQTRLGHADPALTLKWYAHSVEENDRQAAALIGGLFASAEQAKSA